MMQGLLLSTTLLLGALIAMNFLTPFIVQMRHNSPGSIVPRIQELVVWGKVTKAVAGRSDWIVFPNQSFETSTTLIELRSSAPVHETRHEKEGMKDHDEATTFQYLYVCIRSEQISGWRNAKKAKDFPSTRTTFEVKNLFQTTEFRKWTRDNLYLSPSRATSLQPAWANCVLDSGTKLVWCNMTTEFNASMILNA